MNTTRDQIDAESRKDPERLEREIDQQRDTIGNIVSALENKLSPGEIVDRVMRAGKGTGSAIETGGVVGALVLGTMGYGVGAMAKNAVSVVKANPVPALLASTGLVWLYASRQDTAPVHQPGYAQGRTAYGSSASMYSTADYGGSSSEGLRDKASHLRDAASERASHLREGVSERASHLREGASHLRENVAHKLSDARERVGETAHHTADTVRHQADRAREGFSHMMEDKPLVVGAIALGIGALLGAALPVTRKEDELMGETGDKLRSKAGEAGQTVREKGREVAQSVREKGGESAREIRESARGDSAGSGQSHAGSSSATLGSSGASGTSGLSGTTSPGTTGSPRNTI